MGRLYKHRKTEKGTRAYEQVLAHEKEELSRVQHEYGEDSLEAANHEMMVAALHYFMEAYDEAEPLWLRTLEFTKSRFGQSSAETFNALVCLMNNYVGQIDKRLDELLDTMEEVNMLQEKKQQDDGPFLTAEPITESLYRRSKECLSSESDAALTAGFILALMAVSWFVTCFPLAKIVEGTMMMQLRELMESYGVDRGAWEFMVHRSDQNETDPIGLLCVLDEMEIFLLDALVSDHEYPVNNSVA